MRHFSIALMLVALSSGCALTVDDPWPGWLWNWDPIVIDGEAGCDLDASGRAYWYFEAEVDDWDGLDDIDAVEADVYDEWRGGRLADTFELAPTYDGDIWFGEWPERGTALDCHYHGYSVDLVVWDVYDGYSVLTLSPHVL